MAVDTAVKPSRDTMLRILGSARSRQLPKPRFFHASAATSPANLVKLTKSGVDGIVTCGILVNIDRVAVNVIDSCHWLGLDVPGKSRCWESTIHTGCVNRPSPRFEHIPDHRKYAEKAVSCCWS